MNWSQANQKMYVIFHSADDLRHTVHSSYYSAYIRM